MTAAAMVAEFDDVAGWTADAVRQLGDRYAIPATCRGSSSPTALAWLAVVEQIDRPAEVPRSWSRRAEAVAAMVETRHRGSQAYALAARQSRRLAGLFDDGHLSMQLIHATRLGRTA